MNGPRLLLLAAPPRAPSTASLPPSVDTERGCTRRPRQVKQLYPAVHGELLLALQGLRRLRAGRRADRRGADEGRRRQPHPSRVNPPSDAAGRLDAGRPCRAARGRRRRAAAAGPTFAAPFHLAGEISASPYGSGRSANPTWTRLETALGGLEGGEAVRLRLRHGRRERGRARVARPQRRAERRPRRRLPRRALAVRRAPRRARDRGSACGQRRERLRGGDPRRHARVGRDAVEPGPRAPRRRRAGAGGARRGCRDRRRRDARGAAGAAPARARRRPLDDERLQAGHGPRRPQVLGYVAARAPSGSPHCGAGGRSPARSPVRSRPGWRTARWPRSRSAPERQAANAEAIAALLRARDDVEGVRWPGVGPVVASTRAPRPARRPSSPPPSSSTRPRASAACTRPASVARAGERTPCRRAMSGSAPGSRTRPTSSATSGAPSTSADAERGAPGRQAARRPGELSVRAAPITSTERARACRRTWNRPSALGGSSRPGRAAPRRRSGASPHRRRARADARR